MPYLSDLIGRPVADVDGQVMGNVAEVLAHIKTDIAHPRIIALVIKRRKQLLTISMDDVAVLIAPAISLKKKSAPPDPLRAECQKTSTWCGMCWISRSSIPTASASCG